VVKVTDDDEKTHDAKVLSYALVAEKGTVKTPYTVKQSRIFYLPKYRTNCTSGKGRPADWNLQIRKYSVRTSNRPRTEQALRFQRARDQSKLVLGPTASLKNEVSALVAGYSLSRGEGWFAKELEQVLREADEDLVLIPELNSKLHKFLEVNDDNEDGRGTEDEEEEEDTTGRLARNDFTIADATEMHAELHKMWPDIIATPHRLGLLRRGLVIANTTIAYRCLRPFLREALYQLENAVNENVINIDETITSDEAEAKRQDESLADLVTEAAGTVERILGTEPPVAVSTDDATLLLKAVKEKLQEMVSIDSEFGRMLKESTGDQALPCTIQDIWNKYAHACDTDAARTAFMDVTRLLVSAFRQKELHLAGVAENMADLLQKAGV
jgi:hypothetical protein